MKENLKRVWGRHPGMKSIYFRSSLGICRAFSGVRAFRPFLPALGLYARPQTCFLGPQNCFQGHGIASNGDETALQQPQNCSTQGYTTATQGRCCDSCVLLPIGIWAMGICLCHVGVMHVSGFCVAPFLLFLNMFLLHDFRFCYVCCCSGKNPAKMIV
jgi:hypothetical protein